MQGLFRIVAKPVMSAWHAVQTQTQSSIPRPEDAPQAHGTGPDPDRILIIGNGPAVGWGVRSHELALPGQLARELTRFTRRGVDVDLVLSPTNASVARLVTAVRPWRYDAVVVISGTDEAVRLVSPNAWRKTMSQLVEAFQRVSSTSTQIVVGGLSPIRSIPIFDSALGSIADVHAKALNRLTADICREYERASYVPLPVIPSQGRSTRHRTPERYHDWAVMLASHLAPLLTSGVLDDGTMAPNSARALRDQPQDEAERQRAVDRLGITDSRSDPVLEQIVETARTAFGAAGAMITVIDNDRQWHKARVGTAIEQLPRSLSACAIAIRHSDATVVADTQLDQRFAHLPHIRFYAGYPIESPDGYRIGTLCVYDLKPKASAVDTKLLRDLAMQAQGRIHAYLST